MSETSVTCNYGSYVYGAGDVVSALLRAGSPIPGGHVFAQVYGHIFLDPKWLQKDYSQCFTKKTSIQVFEPVTAPPRQQSVNNLTPYCIYLTPKEEIDRKILHEEGVVLQFQLPEDVYPTFLGMACSINYYIALFLEAADKAAVYFPLRVSGAGSSADKQLIRFSHMTIYAGSSLTEATLFESADDVDDDGDVCIPPMPSRESIAVGSQGCAAVSGDNELAKLTDNEADVVKCAWGNEPLFYGSSQISYGIRTDSDELICIITVSRIYAHAGDDLQLWLSFDQSTQGTQCVRATLLQREIRTTDGTLLKERELDSCYKLTRHAHRVCLTLQCSAQEACSFKTPFSEVQYCIYFEFELLTIESTSIKSPARNIDFAGVDLTNKLPWSLPVNFSPYPCLSKYEESIRPDMIGKGGKKGYRIYAPGSLATSALACLEPVESRVATLSLTPAPRL